MLSGGNDGVVRFGEMHLSDPLHELAGHSQRVWDVTFAADSRHAVSASEDGLLIYWDLGAKTALRQVRVENSVVRGIALEADGRQVVFGGARKNVGDPHMAGMLGVWDLASNDPPRLEPGGSAHLGLKLLPDGAMAATDDGGIARVWQRAPLVATARELADLGKRDDALARYGEALAARPDDVRLLIERGRLLTEMGRLSAADTDFARAARLAPDNPQRFLDAGWWVAGPYSPDLNTTAPIEHDAVADPSKSPPTSEHDLRRWRHVPAGMLGTVDLRKAFDADNVGVYALNIVYVQSQKDVVFLVGTDDTARVRLNGRIELECPHDQGADYHAVPVTLKPGRNTILAKVVNRTGPYNFQLRITEDRADFVRAFTHSRRFPEATDSYAGVMSREPDNGDVRVHLAGGNAFAELGRWKEAVPAFRRARALDPENDAIRGDLLRCYIALHDIASYQHLCKEEIERLPKNADRIAINNAIWSVCLAPRALSSYSEVLNIARKLVDGKAVGAALFNTYGALLYRGKKYQAAVTFLKKSIEAQQGKGGPLDWTFLAMAWHQLKEPGDTDALQRAVRMANDPNFNWQYRAEIRALLEEARLELGLPALP